MLVVSGQNTRMFQSSLKTHLLKLSFADPIHVLYILQSTTLFSTPPRTRTTTIHRQPKTFLPPGLSLTLVDLSHYFNHTKTSLCYLAFSSPSSVLVIKKGPKSAATNVRPVLREGPETLWHPLHDELTYVHIHVQVHDPSTYRHQPPNYIRAPSQLIRSSLSLLVQNKISTTSK